MTDEQERTPGPTALERARTIFIANREMLVERANFYPFTQFAFGAQAELAEGSLTPRQFCDILQLLLEQTVEALAARSREAAAAVIDQYVRDIAPGLAAMDEPVTAVSELASRCQIADLLAKSTSTYLIDHRIDQTEIADSAGTPPPVATPSSLPPEPQAKVTAFGPGAPEPTNQIAVPEAPAPERTSFSASTSIRFSGGAAGVGATGPAEANTPRTEKRPRNLADDAVTAVSYEEILRCCTVAHADKRKIIAVVGLAATGKSFFVARLKAALKRRYSWSALKGLGVAGPQAIERTREVLLYRFNRIGKNRSAENFDIYDVPGDLFVKLVRSGFAVAPTDQETLRLIYAIFTFADAMVFIAPSLQVLKRETFLRTGDLLQLDEDERRQRADDIETFIQSLDPMTRLIGHLKESFQKNLSKLRTTRGNTELDRHTAWSRAGERAVDEVLALDFEGIQNRRLRSGQLTMPAALLLSRADELRERLPAASEGFDYDPMFQLLLRAREHLDALSNRFNAFSVDFLTAAEGHLPNTDFDPEHHRSYGCAGLLEHWLLPAIRAARRRSPLVWLQAPKVAIFIRRMLDPKFGAAWQREHSLHD